MIALPRLRCAVCGHPVHGVEVELDRGKRTTTIVAYCHGATDRMVIHDRDKAGWSPEEVRQWEAIARAEVEGVAFTRPSIEADNGCCPHCSGTGWVCEEHETEPMGHDGCLGAGMPCDLCSPDGELPAPPPTRDG